MRICTLLLSTMLCGAIGCGSDRTPVQVAPPTSASGPGSIALADFVGNYRSSDLVVARKAADQLVEAGPVVIPGLLDHMETETAVGTRDEVRCMDTLCRLAASGKEEIFAALESASGRRRALAAGALSNIADHLRMDSSEPGYRIYWPNKESFAWISSEECRAGLLEACDDQVFRTQTLAMETCGLLGIKQAVPSVRRLLDMDEGPLNQQEPGKARVRKEQAFVALALLSRSANDNNLHAYLKMLLAMFAKEAKLSADGSGGLRADSYLTVQLALMKSETAYQLLHKMCSDTFSETERAVGIFALRFYSRPEVVAIARRFMKEDDDYRCHNATITYATLQKEAAIPELVKLVEKGNYVTRQGAIKALGDTKSAKALPYLYRALDGKYGPAEEKLDNQEFALISLGTLGLKEAQSKILPFLRHNSTRLQREAQTAISQIARQNRNADLVKPPSMDDIGSRSE